MPFPTAFPSPPYLFPTYLTSPLPFRRKSSTSSTSSTSTNTSCSPSSPSTTALPSSPSRPHGPSFLPASTARLRCSRCLADLALTSQIISKGFTGRHGRAYLVAPTSSLTSAPPVAAQDTTSQPKASDRRGDLPNTYIHRPVSRQLVTGQHTVGDISCAHCGAVVGWKYVAAEEEAQKYKVGKYILEGKKVVCWGGREDGDGEDQRGHGLGLGLSNMGPVDEEVEFDSQDDDECEDLFMGVWTPGLAKKRRRAKTLGIS